MEVHTLTQPKAVVQPHSKSKPRSKRIRANERNAVRSEKRRLDYQEWADAQRLIQPIWTPKTKRKRQTSRPVSVDTKSAYAQQIDRLERFARQFSQARKLTIRLKLLQEMAELRFSTVKPKLQPLIRAEFDKNKHNWLKLKGICAVCENAPHVRHHIVQIQNGGLNNRKNLILLCNLCHAEIHPWLK